MFKAPECGVAAVLDAVSVDSVDDAFCCSWVFTCSGVSLRLEDKDSIKALEELLLPERAEVLIEVFLGAS
jgi:hypothetical protein